MHFPMWNRKKRKIRNNTAEKGADMSRTDIYGTIGPSCGNQEILTEMFRLGMDGIRLNLSHGELEASGEWTEMIKKAAYAAGKKPGLLIDLQGPELRIGTFKEPFTLIQGAWAELGAGEGDIPLPEILLSSLPDTAKKESAFPGGTEGGSADFWKQGQEILLDDGKIQLELEEVTKTGVRCKVLRGGVLQPRKSIALPGAALHLPTLTESDRRNLAAAVFHGVTGVMLPFVRNAEDLKELKQELIKANAPDIEIFAKIENMEGVRNLENLLPWADVIVIARGDLGNSMPLWELPPVQARIAEACRRAGKPFLVVTQMLASMEEREIPTRAEVSDIFRAVAEGAAGVMVTGETAVGPYPLEVIRYLSNTVREAERYCSGGGPVPY